jgi:hypothetical protein
MELYERSATLRNRFTVNAFIFPLGLRLAPSKGAGEHHEEGIYDGSVVGAAGS